MSMIRGDRRRNRAAAVAALATALAGVLGLPGAALAADVTVTTTPTQVRQGDAVRLEFVVPEERPGSRTTTVELRLPADAPIAEVYPMSVSDWAPRITSRKLDRPVAGIHSAGTDTVTASVIWTRAPGAAAGPARLTLSMGPMPQTDRLPFEVLQTYSDGTVVRWVDAAGGRHPAPTLALLPAAPGAATGHGGHAAPGAAGPGGAAATGGGAVAPAGAAADGGGNADSMLAAGLLAGLGGGAAVGWLVSRWRRGAGPDRPVDDLDGTDERRTDDEPTAAERAAEVEPVAAR